ncbi:KPN_02809 family neutral zinc metallopeptidase [Corynebacterium doosanense]|uniref:Metalloprotease n=1 Tax=Corynebacterium doosanense CAU 212 = DSM 45436 TaxID=558173 RepID=A0A097IGF7_9CORY|nr:neutral zinc metallopeptidase [Corynebacterium doosanense]AIT61187.1 metalloprotease [Corynebacterium doosanense CAU 212 = DSM 45436]
MTFKNNAQGGGRVRRGGGGGGMALGAGGGIGGLLLVGLFLLLGGNPEDLNQGAQQDPSQGAQGQQLENCSTGADANANAECRVDFTVKSLDAMWAKLLPAQAGIEYAEPGVTVFTNQTQTGCGGASSATGPFYCPNDQTAYFDVTFFEQIEQLGGSDAPLAQEYIVAHEVGHHIQNLEGTLGLSNYNDPGEDSAAVALETQADCYAGIWAHHAAQGEDALLEPITDDQLATAIETARAVGDDNIQQRSGGDVNPDTWTHGSSEDRQNAFMAGYQSGNMSSCDFLRRGNYRDA